MERFVKIIKRIAPNKIDFFLQLWGFFSILIYPKITVLLNVVSKSKSNIIRKLHAKTFPYLIEKYITKKDQISVEEELRQWLDSQTDSEKKVLVLHLICTSMLLSSYFMQEYIKSIENLHNELDLKYYLGVFETAWLPFIKPQALYPEYYSDRKRLLNTISNQLLNAKSILYESQVSNKRRVALLVIGLHGKKFASARLEVYIANELSRRGFEVSIVVSDGNKRNGEYIESIFPQGTRYNTSRIFEKDHTEMKSEDVEIFYISEEAPVEKFHSVLKTVYDISPEFIVDITWENAVYTPVLMEHFSVINVPLGGFCTSANFDYYISRDNEQIKKKNEIFNSIDLKKTLEANLYLPYDIQSHGNFKREKYGIGYEDFVFVTVGNRLQYDLTQEFIDEVGKMLLRNNNFKWVIIGNGLSVQGRIKQLIDQKRIIYWGYEHDLAGLYKMCDAFLNPPRLGGGGSIAMAIQCRILAIVNDTPSDILPFIGHENCVKGGIKELIAFAELVASDDALYNEKLRQMYSSMMSSRFSLKNFVDVILEANEACGNEK